MHQIREDKMKMNISVLLVIVAGCCVISAQQNDAVDKKVASASRCLSVQPLNSRCKAAKPAFYFDLEQRGCRGILYGGCPGDEAVDPRSGEINLFMDEQECKTVCKELLCPEQLCMMECPQGFKTDETGCKTCQCKQPVSACPQMSCPDICSAGYELDVRGCQTCTCKKSDKVAACQQMACTNVCPNGYVFDSQGCQTCQCDIDGLKPNHDLPPAPPCPAVECPNRCPRGYKEDAQKCQTCDCIEPSPSCPTNRATCMKYCEHGFMLHQDGCERCACAGSPVQPPVPCPLIECSGVCPRGYKKDAKGCQTCECLKEGKACEKKALCAMYCEFGYMLDQSGCPLCACAPEPEEKKTECSPVACNLYCPDKGFKKDENGCSMCECELDPCLSASCLDDEICVPDTTHPTRDRHTQVYTVRCEKINNNAASFNMMLTVIAVLITCSLTAVISAIFVVACTRRNQRRRANAIYKPLDPSVHM